MYDKTKYKMNSMFVARVCDYKLYLHKNKTDINQKGIPTE